jgi:hypothetical protein
MTDNKYNSLKVPAECAAGDKNRSNLRASTSDTLDQATSNVKSQEQNEGTALQS